MPHDPRQPDRSASRNPAPRNPAPRNPAAADLAHALRQTLSGEADFGPAARGVYAYDASNYRHPPLGVVWPRDRDDVRAALAAARAHGVPVLARGAGTSIGGQAVSPGALVLDFRRHFRSVTALDPEARTATVQPGLVLDDLRQAAARHHLTFGPDPSTHSRATLGGMIGNDSCGAHSVAWGRTADNVRSLDVILADGTELRAPGPTTPAARAALLRDTPGRAGELLNALHDLTDQNLALLRRAFPALPRRVSGYALDALLPERGFDLARALTGSEGTCAVLLEATVALVAAPAVRVLVAAGYRDETAAAEAVVDLLPLRPLTAEGMGADLVRDPAARALLPRGGGWLLLEAGGGTPAEARDHAERLARAARAQGATTAVLEHPDAQRQLWRVREAAAGTATRAPDGSEAWPGWEDSAVPPERLGGYLRELRALMADHGLHGVPYGHFGEGCVHLRLDFPLGPHSPHSHLDPLDTPTSAHAETTTMRAFLEAAADLVVRHGGSLSGEHGDGQARGELLTRMYPPELLSLFARFKDLFDPEDRLNPGNLVRPRPLDADLRTVGLDPALPLADGARRCVGVAACVTEHPTGVMCPSYAVTRDERHSTRGRARLLAELLRGLPSAPRPFGSRPADALITDGWRSTEVRDALDLCLSCKGCASDCPVHVDMATYKSEFLHRHYRRRLRPRTHWTLGALPRWLRLLHSVPGTARLAAAALRRPRLEAVAKRLAGTAPERPLPPIPPRPFTATATARAATAPPATAAPAEAPHTAGDDDRVVLWPDTFSNHLAPHVLAATAEVLARAGFRPVLPSGPVCCGLTWVTTGRLDAARKVMRRTLRTIAPLLAEGLPVVVAEPSCAAALREELPRHLPGPGAAELASRVRTLAEFLDAHAPDAFTASVAPPAPAASPPAASPPATSPPATSPPAASPLLTQVHCHQHAVLGTAADARLAARLGWAETSLTSGCCGLAGNFGFEPGHVELSTAAAERALLPALRAAPDAPVRADGFSCRIQIDQLDNGRRAFHLAELLLQGLSEGCKNV